ncbi:MAG: urate hydroxylase PuuD [Bacteroidetes bacterium]|jgi:uncharacterized membrane protein|nr:urate hydroxylase PuuD [Bacteroidota bacterium]
MAQEIVLSFLRWSHVISGVVWLGFAYVFVFVLLPASAAVGAELKRTFALSLHRRLFAFVRWGSLIAWASGVVMLGMLYHSGGRMFDNASSGWNAAAGIAVLLVFLLFSVYDALARHSFFSDLRRLGLLGLLVTIAMVELMSGPAGMGYSAVLIHIGTMYGTIMTANVWMRIWPAQREALAAWQNGREADTARLAVAAQCSRHNAYLSVPLLWTMLAQHTVIPGALSPLWFYGVIIVGWGLVALLESRTTVRPAA